MSMPMDIPVTVPGACEADLADMGKLIIIIIDRKIHNRIINVYNSIRLFISSFPTKHVS